jgi:hypothetical protein
VEDEEAAPGAATAAGIGRLFGITGQHGRGGTETSDQADLC